MKNLKRIKLKKYIYVTFQEIWAEQVASFSLKPPSGPEADFVLSNLGKRKLEVWWQTQPCLDLSLALSPLSLTRRLPQRSWSTITTILLITLLDVILPFLFTIFIPGPLSSAVPHDRLPRLGWRRHLVGSYLHLLFISVLHYMCSNCIPDKVVHAGHDNLPLDFLTGLPQLCGTLCTLTSCIPAFHLILATGGQCLQSHEGSGQGVLLKCLLQPLRLRHLSLQGCSKLKTFLLHQQPQERLASLRSQWNSYVWCVSQYRTHSVSCDFLSNSMISCKYVVCVINGKMSLGPSVKVKVKDHPSRKTLL